MNNEVRTYRPLEVRETHLRNFQSQPYPCMTIHKYKNEPHKVGFNARASKEMRRKGFKEGMFVNAYQTSDGLFALMRGSDYRLRKNTNCNSLYISNLPLAEAFAEVSFKFVVEVNNSEIILRPIKGDEYA